MRIGIVGAGIAGLACAQALTRRGHDVVLFDKGRGPGGRMSTRRVQTARGEACFDHGAQYFTVRDDDFSQQVSAWIEDGVVAPWPAAGSDAYVGVPAMNSPVRWLAEGQDVRWSARVTGLATCGDGWRLSLDGGEVADVDLAVIAVPAEQAAALLSAVASDLASRAAAAISDPCWTAMAAFSQPVPVAGDCWRADDAETDRGQGIVGWAARNSAKPGRTGPESWVIQATPDWSRDRIDADPDEVGRALRAELSNEFGVQLPAPIGTASHLWRFARSAQGGSGPILDPERRLGLCGDWLIGPRVESAWLSGARLADMCVNAG